MNNNNEKNHNIMVWLDDETYEKLKQLKHRYGKPDKTNNKLFTELIAQEYRKLDLDL